MPQPASRKPHTLTGRVNECNGDFLRTIDWLLFLPRSWRFWVLRSAPPLECHSFHSCPRAKLFSTRKTISIFDLGEASHAQRCSSRTRLLRSRSHIGASKTPARDGPFVARRRELREQKARSSDCYSRTAENDFCQGVMSAESHIGASFSRPPSRALYPRRHSEPGLLVNSRYYVQCLDSASGYEAAVACPMPPACEAAHRTDAH